MKVNKKRREEADVQRRLKLKLPALKNNFYYLYCRAMITTTYYHCEHPHSQDNRCRHHAFKSPMVAYRVAPKKLGNPFQPEFRSFFVVTDFKPYCVVRVSHVTGCSTHKLKKQCWFIFAGAFQPQLILVFCVCEVIVFFFIAIFRSISTYLDGSQ